MSLVLGPRPASRARRALWDLRRGLWFDYPLCCVLQYALGTLLGVGRHACRRGIVARKGAYDRSYVPCQWHEGRAPGWRRRKTGT